MTAPIQTFRDLHESGTFVMPNPFDAGSARLLDALGFSALATTSAGLAATLGRSDMAVTRDELVAHVRDIAAATELPLNVDAERCFADDADGVAETVGLLAAAGASGLSIEDWDPDANRIDDVDVAAGRVRAAADAAAMSGVVLTARCENHFHGIDDLDDTVARLQAYLDAGADVVYAPGLTTADDIGRVVALGAPVNALLLPGGPTVGELTDMGVRRVSVGSLLQLIAHGAMAAAATALRDTGALPSGAQYLDGKLATRAFAART